jgi:hypothetical protein
MDGVVSDLLVSGENAPGDLLRDGDGSAPPPLSFDVVVVGSGSGGVAAALQASRLGATVALVEETDWIGGQMTAAAVPNMDGGREPQTITGIWAEFRSKVHAYYGDTQRFPPGGKSAGTCYWSDKTTCFEPFVGQLLLKQMLAETPVKLMLGRSVVKVLQSGDTVTGVILDDGTRIDCRIVVDATERGDVIPLTTARYRIGRSLSTSPDTTDCIQDLTYVAVIKHYPGGLPAGLEITAPPPGYAALRPVYQDVVTANGSDISWPINYPVNWPTHSAYRGLPDSSNPSSYTGLEPNKITKTCVNWANDYPGRGHSVNPGPGPFGPWRETLEVGYLEQPALRKQIDCEAKLYTLGFIYYAQTELGQSSWSVATDEGYDTAHNKARSCPNIPAALKPLEHHLPPMPYVRESRRIVPVKTLTAKQIKRVGSPPRQATTFPTAMAVGDYPTDLHNCSEDAQLESDLNETGADKSPGGPFQVPFEALIPEQVDGLLAAEKNIGVSRLAAGSIRLQPITLATGQAAGAIAALAVKKQVAPRKLRPIDVQRTLLEQGAGLALDHFDDIPSPPDPLWRAVQLANVHGIMVGVAAGTFAPSDPLTREQAAMVLARLFDLDLGNPPTTASFADVPTTRWSYAAVEAIYKAGYTAGCSTSPLQFCPTAPATRAQMAFFLVKGLGLDPATAPKTPIFDDVAPGDPFFASIQLAASSGIIAGCSTSPKQYCPAAAITRGQTAAAVAETLAVK